MDALFNFQISEFADAKPIWFDWFSLIINGVLIVLGFIVAFAVYFRQRKDAANDAYELFQDCLIMLNSTLKDTVHVLDEYKESLGNQNDEIRNPSLPTSLNDKFLLRIDLPALSRYYKDKYGANGSNKLRDFLKRSTYLGGYFGIFINEVNYFRTNFHKMEFRFKEYQFLLGPMFFKSLEHRQGKMDNNFIQEYITLRNKIVTSQQINQNGTVINRTLLNQQFIIPLIELSGRHILNDSLANEINHIANNVNSARIDLEALKSSTAKVIGEAIEEFNEIQTLINSLLVGK